MESSGSAPRRSPDFPQDRAAQLRRFGPLGLLAILIIFFGAAINPIISALLILCWVRVSRTPWNEIGFVQPKSWIVAIAVAVTGGAVFKLAMKSLVMPLLGAAPTNAAYHYLIHNPRGLAVMIFYIIVGAGFAEETFFRGYLFERLGKLFGQGLPAKAAIVVLTSALFGIVHLQGQGIDAVKQATIVGLVFGSLFAWKRELFSLMIAHASFDLVAVLLIYFDLETKVTHLFFQ